MESVNKSKAINNSPIRKGSPIDRRRRSAQAFLLRSGLLLLFMGVIAYAAWFAPWARPIRTLKIETGQPVGIGRGD